MLHGYHDTHSPMHNMSPGAHHILNIREMHLLHFDVWQTEYIDYFTPIMPPYWNVIEMDWNVYPHGRMLQPTEKGGIMMTFAGPTQKIPHRKGANTGNESFMLWFMPMPYSGTSMPDFSKFPAEVLGYTPTHAIYSHQLTAKIPTWPNYKTELIKILRLTPEPVIAS